MSGIFLAPNEYCCAEDELILKMSIIKCFLASTHRIWTSEIHDCSLPFRRSVVQHVGENRKNDGDFLKNVGDFLENDGDFSKNVGVFFLNNGALFLSDGRLSKRHGAFRCNTLPRKSLLMESLARKRENTALKSVAIISSRAGARPRTTAIYAFLLSQPSQISA